MKMSMSNEAIRRKTMADCVDECEAGTLHPEAPKQPLERSRVSELRKRVDKLLEENRDPQHFKVMLVMLLMETSPSENHVVLSRVFEKIRSFSEDEYLDLIRVPDGLLDFVESIQ